MEFDATSKSISPNFLFGYWPQKHAGERNSWLFDSALPALYAGQLSPRLVDNVRRCFDACSGTATDFQVGVMLARDVQAVRVCIFDLPPEDTLPYLDRIGWKGPKQELRQLLESFRPLSDFLGLHLDIGEQVFPHIGIEPNFVAECWSRQPHHEPRWFGLFDRLLELGLLTDDEQMGLHGWIGHQQTSAPDGESAIILRGLSHFKVVLRPDRTLAAKAYFGFAHRRLSRGGAKGATA